MDFIKKCCQCYCFSQKACGVAQCIDIWHSYEACGLCYLYCDAGWWTLTAPICIDCKLGEVSKCVDNCTKGCKYCVFACALECVAPVDGCFNCFEIIKLSCTDEGVKGYADFTKNAEVFANKVKEALGLETGNEPLKSMSTFEP